MTRYVFPYLVAFFFCANLIFQLSQIVRVLNGHLVQLQWIDTNATALQAKVSAAQKASGNMGTSTGFSETDAAEGFYRSYRGGYK